MPGPIRPLVSAVAALGILAGGGPALAAVPSEPAPSASPESTIGQAAPGQLDTQRDGRAADGPVALASLPVPATDVTLTDTSLRSTTSEVAVIAADEDGTLQVTKLRASSPQAAEELAEYLDAQPGVTAAPNAPVHALSVIAPEPLATEQWYLPMIGAPAAWRLSTGRGVQVAVIDTGVDPRHPDLSGRVLPAVDLLARPSSLPDGHGHGTGVASIIAGQVNRAGMAGAAPEARILPVRVLDATGAGDTSTVARGIIAAANAGARVINLSLGGPDRDPVLDSACSYAYRKGSLVVAAAGNSYLQGNRVQYPAASPSVIGVASVDASGLPSYFSNSGSYVDVAAPGEDILAAVPGGGYARVSGTSFAAPQVAAVAALVTAVNPALNVGQVASLVQRTAVDDPSGDGRDPRFGQGVVRADRAVAAARTQRPAPPTGARLRIRTLDAGPEPVRAGRTLTVTARVQARYQDGSWRNSPTVRVRLEFRTSSRASYRTVAEVTATSGVAVLKVRASRTGTWRARVRQADGSWTSSATDWAPVRR